MPPPPPPPVTDGSCTLFRCFCCWRRRCSPRIPRVAPGRDYVCIPAGADDRPAWSLLVGFRADSGLRLHRFRVAPSGRILGRSNDALEIFHHFDNDCAAPTWGANATLSPDGRSLCIFCSKRLVDAESKVVSAPVLELQLQDDKKTITQLPTVLLGRLMDCSPVTAGGDIWAPYFHLIPHSPCRLVMQRLDRGDGRWVVAGTIEFPYEMENPMKWGGSIFQGHAVIHDTILVSLRPAHLLFSFSCSTCTWTAITTITNRTTTSKNPSFGTRSENTSTSKDTTRLDTAVSSSAPINPSPGSSSKNISRDNTTSSINTSSGSTTLSGGTTRVGKYVPIRDRGVYVEEDDAIYFLQKSTIYAYKLHGRGQGQQPLVELKPPTKIDSVCPFYPDGFGLLTHLGGRVMCSVWISVARDCSCDKYHVIISTFQVKYGSAGIANGIEILHSTCRQLDMFPCKPTVLPVHEFCFLQEYEYNHENAMAPPRLLEGIEDSTSYDAEDSSEMLACCRKFLYKPSFPRCYVLREPACRINRDLYIVCQAGSRLIAYRTEIVDGRLLPSCNYIPLRLHLGMNIIMRDSHTSRWQSQVMQQPSLRYFMVRSLTNIYAVSYKPDDICEFELSRPSSNLLKTSRPAGVCFAVVLHVGHRIVAVTHSLEVYLFVPPTSRCFLLNLNVREWEDVLPDVESRTLLFHDPLIYGRQRLNGRSIYFAGYIYSCTNWGLVAYDFHDGLLHDEISLPFSWRKTTWEGESMCLDFVGAEQGAVVFCVVQGECFSGPHGQDVYVTIVQVKTTKTPVGKFRPESIDHVDIATCLIPLEDGVVSTRSCFSVEH
ncbi:uncharacterized protein LOC124662933 [Lolium rigidum]|uniref:uncharacterized protein LOC124662933 n=1 Tax=Lolium rigidum TaxID=89674 RepID=UPI001F5C8F4E|nr:uncharacterized protein LOC124662933 [Lolium rigidum]